MWVIVKIMRIISILLLVTLPAVSVAQDTVSYRNVELSGRDEGKTAIEFTLDLPDTLSAARVRAAGERHKLAVGRAEAGLITFGKTVPGVCDRSQGVFVQPGQRAPTGPCVITYTVTWSAGAAGKTTFRVSAAGYMKLPGSDLHTGGGFTPRSSNWSLVRQLTREIAEEHE